MFENPSPKWGELNFDLVFYSIVNQPSLLSLRLICNFQSNQNPIGKIYSPFPSDKRKQYFRLQS
jgi:hypothetical protein